MSPNVSILYHGGEEVADQQARPYVSTRVLSKLVTVSTTRHPPVQDLVAPACNVSLGIVASSDELVGKGLQGGDLLLLQANRCEVKGACGRAFPDCRFSEGTGYFG
jgi:hypothetical protein